MIKSVWDDLADTPAEAKDLKLRSGLMITLSEHIKARGWSEDEAARELGVTPARLNELMRGKLDRFDLSELIAIADAAGLNVEIQAAPAE